MDQTNQIVQLAAKAGRLILENGGEVFRVEETVTKICGSFGVENCQINATITALTASAADREGYSHAVVERINYRGVNLDKVDAVNQLSYAFQREKPTLAEAAGRLRAIQDRPQYPPWAIILFSAMACAAFTALFGGTLWDILPAFLAGGLVRVLMTGLKRISLNEFFINVLGGAVATSAGWLAALAAPSCSMDSIVSAVLMLLVPGLMVTNAIRDITAGDLLSGISRMMEAFFVAMAIAMGTALSYMLISAMGGGR